jgi:hypothetical protein
MLYSGVKSWGDSELHRSGLDKTPFSDSTWNSGWIVSVTIMLVDGLRGETGEIGSRSLLTVAVGVIFVREFLTLDIRCGVGLFV